MSRTTKVDLSKGAHLNEPQRNDPEDPKEVLDRLSPRGQQQEWTQPDAITIRFDDGSTVQILERLVTQELVKRHNVELTAEREKWERQHRERWESDAYDRGCGMTTKLHVEPLKQKLAAERQRREQAEEQLKIRATEYVPTTKFLELREQLLSALAAIEDALKAPWTDVGQILSPVDLSALHEHDAKVRSKADKDWREQVAELITEHEQELAEVREPLVDLATAMLKALKTVPVNYVTPQLCEGDIKRWDDALANVQRSNVSTETKNHESTPVRPENL